ncbi:MAG: AmmeMemoRadiSam system protein A [Verrucomicrobiales bacterium]|nr:AmmeMemoRadiSam system protein A [Verrucomicrobiales bacterium]
MSLGSEAAAIIGAVLMPHAPILVPAVGGERGGAVEASCRAMRTAAACVTSLQPETIVVISPHSPRKPGAFGLWADDRLEGAFTQFNAPHARVSLPNDQPLIEAIVAEAQAGGVETWLIHNRSLDHGALVPLWFLAGAGWSGPTVVLSLNNHDEYGLTKLGEVIAAAASALRRRVAIVASGDMSHRLTPDAPGGFHPQAHRFDEIFMRLIRAGDYREIQHINPELREVAAEDAADSTMVAAAAVKWNATGHKVLSYEGPFGVGYGVAILFIRKPKAQGEAATSPARASRDGAGLPGLARRAVETARRGSPATPPAASGEYLNEQRGVFVTLRHRNGNLRGCAGTIDPVCTNLVAETWRNACVAAFQDARFPPVAAAELADLRFHVNVIHSIEDISTPDELDPQRYGMIVFTADGRRGILLPGIEDIKTGEDQLKLAQTKGGIRPNEPMKVRRFQVDHFADPD